MLNTIVVQETIRKRFRKQAAVIIVARPAVIIVMMAEVIVIMMTVEIIRMKAAEIILARTFLQKASASSAASQAR